MSNMLKFYIADILNECEMEKNQEAQDMLLREFTYIYKECLKKHDPEYDEYMKNRAEEQKLSESIDKYGYFECQPEEEELPENEAAFQEAKEKFGIHAVVDKAYVVMNTYKHYQFVKKMSITVLRVLALISCMIAFYGVAFANDVDAKILTLTLWVIMIIISVSFAIVFNSADSKVEKLFSQLSNKFTYFYIKNKDNQTLREELEKPDYEEPEEEYGGREYSEDNMDYYDEEYDGGENEPDTEDFLPEEALEQIDFIEDSAEPEIYSTDQFINNKEEELDK